MPWPVLSRFHPVVTLAALVAAGCGDPLGSGGGAAQLSIQPTLPPSWVAGLFPLAVDRARVLVLRPPAEAVVDTTVLFPPDAASLSVRLRVPLTAIREILTVTVELRAGQTPLFTGSRSIEMSEATGTAPPIPLQYVGPGTGMTSLRISPRDSVLQPDARFSFLIEAFSGGTSLDQFYVAWSTSDPVLAPIDAHGTLTAPSERGSVFVHAVSPNGIRDSTQVWFSPPPASMGLAGGNVQTGFAGAPLEEPLRVLVLAGDGVAVPGVRVRFTSLSGGQVADPVAITGEDGIAETIAILGPATGLQAFQATSPQLTPVTFTATSLPGVPGHILVVSGANQIDTVGRTLAPFLARVTDVHGNPLPGIGVTWQAVSGGGTLTNAGILTNALGLTAAQYQLGLVPGVHTVRVSVTDAPGLAVEFQALAVAGAPADFLLIAGDGQTDTARAVLAPFVVEARDALNNPLAGVQVQWAALTPGGDLATAVSFTDAAGRAQNVYRLPAVPGDVAIVAEIPGTAFQIEFLVNATPASAATLLIQDGNGQTAPSGTVLNPFEVLVRDQFGNPVPGGLVSWEIVEGDGALAPTQSASDAAGVARSTYTLGPTPGSHRVRARLGSGAEVTFVVEAL